ncbi:HNH endonuclease [Nocardioides mangrovi]|nr:HNH endonuclease signature motif containing protein [Nocardioides mangrovi]
MTDQEAADALVELQSLKAQVAELEARLARHADDQHVGQDRGSSSTAVWLANQTRTTRAAAHAIVKLGKQLHAHPYTRAALAAGVIGRDQARVILRWVDTLPDETNAEQKTKAEQHLLDLAAEHDATALDRLGRRLWEVIDPDGADAHEAEILDRQEQAALRATYLRIWDDGHGKTHYQGVMPTLEGAAFTKIVLATMAAKHQNAVKGSGTGPEEMGQAFSELIMRYPKDKLPKTGGLNATLLVTIPEDALLGRLEQAGTILDTGDRISAALARQLACEAGILPVVLNGKSEILDLGREQRLHSQAQRIAITLRQHGQCATEGCDRTTGLHAHHLIEWAKGGRTDLANAIGLCHWHHMRAHDTTYDMTRDASGSVSFHRRQ